MKKTRHLTAAMLSAFACAAVADFVPVSTDTAIDWTDKAVRRQAVLETAYAYYLRDGHAQMLHVAGGGSDVASALGRTNGGLRKAMFDGLLHGRSANYLKRRTKIVVLRPLALPD